MAETGFRGLIESACEYLTQQQEMLDRSFKIGSYKRYDWDQDTGELVFSDAGIPIVVARIQFVGSVSTRTNTWLWSWANDSIDTAVKTLILKVREFGETRGLEKLVTPCWPADEVDGWEMTSIAASILRAKGAYRTPDENGFTYMIITDVRWYLAAAQARSVESRPRRVKR